MLIWASRLALGVAEYPDDDGDDDDKHVHGNDGEPVTNTVMSTVMNMAMDCSMNTLTVDGLRIDGLTD